MGLFGKENVMNMIHHDGLPHFSKGCATSMELDEDSRCLIFRSRAIKNTPEIKLPLNKVQKAGSVNITEIEEQSKIGRAVVGGLLFGKAGAVIGAMSAGEKKKIKTLYIINYTSDDETKAIVMQSNGSNLNFFKFQNKLKGLLQKQEESKTPDIIIL